MLITSDLFIDFANCKYKASLKASGKVGIVPEHQRLHEALNREYTNKALPEIRARFRPTDIVESPPSLRHAMLEGTSLILRPSTIVADLAATFDAVTKDKRPSQDPEYHPVLFSRFNKIRMRTDFDWLSMPSFFRNSKVNCPSMARSSTGQKCALRK
jgi:hypothetical protein